MRISILISRGFKGLTVYTLNFKLVQLESFKVLYLAMNNAFTKQGMRDTIFSYKTVNSHRYSEL